MAGKFNFGEPPPERHRARIGGRMALLEHPTRKETNITKDDVKLVARMFLVDSAEIEDICKKFDATEMEIRKVITGRNFHQLWSSAVVDLLAEGHKCDRKIHGLIPNQFYTGNSRGLPSKKLEADVVRRIRTLHMAGSTLAEITELIGCRHTVVRGIVRNETYKKPEYVPEGWGE